MKRGIAFILSLFLISFVSAQFFDGYNSFSVTGFFDSINSQDIILLTFFIVIFAFLFVILSRIPLFRNPYGQPNKAIPTVISFAISLLSVYGIYKSDFDLQGSFSGFGLPTDIFYPLLLIILIVAAVFIIWKLGVGTFFLIFGSLIILVTIFTDVIYEKGVALIIGGISFFIGLWLWKRARRKMMQGMGMLRQNYNWQQEKSEFKWGAAILGILAIVFGFLINQIIIIVMGIVLALIGLWRIFRSPRTPITDPRRLLSPGSGY